MTDMTEPEPDDRFKPAGPGETPGSVEPDDQRPEPLDLGPNYPGIHPTD